MRQRSSGSWQARLPDGGSLGTFQTRAQAEKALSLAEAQTLRGLVPPPPPEPEPEPVPTLRDWSERWLEKRSDLRPRTRELYRDLLDRHILPALGDRPLDELTVRDLERWYHPLRAEHPATAARSYRLVAVVLRSASALGVMPGSPPALRGAGVEHAAERPVVRPDDLPPLVEAMPPRLRIVPLLASWCALRRGEILGLQRQDLDLARGVVHIRRTRQWSRAGVLVGPPKSDAGRRSVAIPPHLLPPLADHLAAFVAHTPDAWLVTGDRGGPVTPSRLEAAWRVARARAGLPALRLHDLRHSGLTWTARAGATTAELQHRAGHASPAAALRYQHATEDRDRALAKALSEARYGPGLARSTERGR